MFNFTENMKTILKIQRQYGKYKDNAENMNAKRVAVKISEKMNFAISKNLVKIRILSLSFYDFIT